jgi:hypothetical protein
MLYLERISIGRVKQAYGLNENEAENAIQSLWPDNVFPVELWRRTHEIYWRSFADSNQAVYKIEIPALPEVDTTKKFFHTYLCSVDVMTFFRKLSLNIQANILREGLKYILEESYEDIDSVFPEERQLLFSTLARLNTVDFFDQYSSDSELFEEKILSLPDSIYHFISHIFSDTVLVDTVAVIRHFRNYPLRQEVKDLSQRLVDFVLNLPATETLDVPETAIDPADLSVEDRPHDRKFVFRIPTSLWEGKPDATVRNAMRDDYPLAVIAFVLVNWCGVTSQAGYKTQKGRKTHVGRLLSGKKYKDDKSYRNFVNHLLQEADSHIIVKA